MESERTSPKLVAEMEDLRARLAEAEETLNAIRNGEVDGWWSPGRRGSRSSRCKARKNLTAC